MICVVSLTVVECSTYGASLLRAEDIRRAHLGLPATTDAFRDTSTNSMLREWMLRNQFILLIVRE